uniref:Uncharacterized protein n=1 Tax=Colletotrichum fructicola (strain Nara gc5) TaxID=1213859 RepID=L2G236_COLFN
MFELGFVFKFQAYDVFQVVIVSPSGNLLGFYPADREIPELVFEITNTIWLLPAGNPSGQE